MRWTTTHAYTRGDDERILARPFVTDLGVKGSVWWDPQDWLAITIYIGLEVRICAAHVGSDRIWSRARSIIEEWEKSGGKEAKRGHEAEGGARRRADGQSDFSAAGIDREQARRAGGGGGHVAERAAGGHPSAGVRPTTKDLTEHSLEGLCGVFHLLRHRGEEAPIPQRMDLDGDTVCVSDARECDQTWREWWPAFIRSVTEPVVVIAATVAIGLAAAAYYAGEAIR